MNKIKAEIAARCFGDARTNPRLAERAALVTGVGKSDTGPLTVEPDVGKITVCRQEADSPHDGLHRVRCVSRFRPAAPNMSWSRARTARPSLGSEPLQLTNAARFPLLIGAAARADG